MKTGSRSYETWDNFFHPQNDLLEKTFVTIPDQEWLYQVPGVPSSHQSPIF